MTRLEIEFMAAILICLIPSLNLFAFNRSGETDSTGAFVVSNIILEGNEFTKSYVILRELPFKVGDSVNTSDLDYARERIYSTALFTKVIMQHGLISRGKADVLIYVEERWYIWPYPIVGFRDREVNWKKLYAGAGVVDFNFRGMDDKIEAMFAFGYDPFVSIYYNSPSIGANRDYLLWLGATYAHGRNLGLESGYSEGQFDDSFGDFYVAAGKRLNLYSILSVGTAYNYVSRNTNDSNSVALSPNGKDIYASLWAEYFYDSRDLKIYAMQGSYLDIVVEKYGLGESIVNFGRASFDSREYLPVWDFLSLMGRLYGSFAIGSVIPRYNHVFFGYGEKIRGMFNTVSEGQSYTGGNFEIRVPIIKKMYLQLPWLSVKEFESNRIGIYWNFFLDAGETSDKYLHMKWNRTLYGYGGGVSFVLPYDWRIEVDYARGSDRHLEWILDFGQTL